MQPPASMILFPINRFHWIIFIQVKSGRWVSAIVNCTSFNIIAKSSLLSLDPVIFLGKGTLPKVTDNFFKAMMIKGFGQFKPMTIEDASDLAADKNWIIILCAIVLHSIIPTT
ncbi:hypothetical protein BH20BAC1_BH20BAC1_26260 [soil metagenome]